MIADTTMPAFIISPRNRRVWEEIVVAAVASGKTAKEAVAIADDVVREVAERERIGRESPSVKVQS